MQTSKKRRRGSGDDGSGGSKRRSGSSRSGAVRSSAVHLARLPAAAMYEKSYMHRAPVTCLCVSATDFVITGSGSDGVVKFWHKSPVGLVFVKAYKAMTQGITHMALSVCGRRLAVLGSSVEHVGGSMLKLFDVVNFDMVAMIKLPCIVTASTFVSSAKAPSPILAMADTLWDEPGVWLIDPGAPDPLASMQRIRVAHAAPIHHLVYNAPYDAVVSVDVLGGIETWSSVNGLAPDYLDYTLKADTGLYALQDAKASARSLAVSPNGKLFAVMGSDRVIRIWKFLSGKLHREYDESYEVVSAAQKSPSSPYVLDSIDYGRRFAQEKAYDADADAAHATLVDVLRTSNSQSTVLPAAGPPPSNVIFDAASRFVLYPTLVGVKVVNLRSNRVERILGKVESSERFVALALYQGAPALVRIGSGGGATTTVRNTEGAEEDPLLLAASFRKDRFFYFSSREPDVDDPDGRDVFNERPKREDLATYVAGSSAGASGSAASGLPSTVILHTTMGDIHLELYPDSTPKTVENFTTHCSNGYYDGIIFHRVIKDFMIQTGDPDGNGTGGASIWGGNFADELIPELNHDAPFVLAMANSGPNTNGSQFYITTVPTPWLNGKHTVFGKVTQGIDVVRAIERVPVTSATNRPISTVSIVSATVKKP